jgi:sugar transferase (PEP-CTERM system associated)
MIKIFRNWLHGATVLRLLVDFACLILCFVIAIEWLGNGLPVNYPGIVLYLVFLALVTLALNAGLGVYQRQRDRKIYDTVARALISLYIATPIAYGLFSFFPMSDVNRHFIELSVIVGIYGMLANRVRAMHFSVDRKIRVLIFGTGERAVEVKRMLEQSDPDALIVGFFSMKPDEQPEIDGVRVVGRGMQLLETARGLNVDELVVAVAERRGGVMPLRALLDCKLIGVNVVDLATHFERRLGQIRLDSLTAGWLIFGDGFNQGIGRMALKRLSDVVFSVILLVLASPVILITALLIVIENGFPILYRQDRVGRDGRSFPVIKFRSMRNDAEKDGKPRFATANDDRTTRVGRFIRKYRIDELPQLVCVIKGDMSIVGPRPERPFFVDQLTQKLPFYAARHSVKPGVTGWAQVRYAYGENLEDSAEKLQYDLYYVKNHSLFLDTLILFETVGVVLSGKGAR